MGVRAPESVEDVDEVRRLRRRVVNGECGRRERDDREFDLEGPPSR
jgi:hypothetical protein